MVTWFTFARASWGRFCTVPRRPCGALPFQGPKPMVSADHPAVYVVADEGSAKRRQILDGACKVFVDLGFDGACMSDIARAAGVSKGTLYVYFDDKCRLFEAIVERIE